MKKIKANLSVYYKCEVCNKLMGVKYHPLIKDDGQLREVLEHMGTIKEWEEIPEEYADLKDYMFLSYNNVKCECGEEYSLDKRYMIMPLPPDPRESFE